MKRNAGVAAAVLSAALVSVLSAFSVFPAAASAAGSTSAAVKTASDGRRTVRIGISDGDTQTATGTENRTVAFMKDYLQAVAGYAGWDCDFVEASWADCLRMLKDGELDAVPDVSKTEERLAYYDYPSESMGTEMCYLFGRADTNLQYDDFASFDGIEVGYEEGSTILDSFREYASQTGFTFRGKPYVSGAAMFAALDAGEIDAVVQTNFYDTPTGHVILAKCSPSPVYVATCRKDPSLIRELNSAMSQLLSYRPGFNAELYDYHFGDMASQTSGYTQQEADYLASQPTVDVVYETTWEPFEYERGGEAAGITPDVIRAIAADTGIRFRFVLTGSTQSVYKEVGSRADDTIMAVSYDYSWAAAHNLLMTQPYVSGTIVRVSRNGMAEPKTVAIVADGYLGNQVQKAYPELKTVSYLTFAECMKSLQRGDVDCTFLNYYQATYYRSETTYENYIYQPDSLLRQGIALGITRESDPALYGILSKSLQRISTATQQSILNNNSTQKEAFSLSMLVRRYPVQMAAALGLVLVLVGILIVLLVTSDLRKRQNERLAAAKSEAEAANNAKTEFLSRMSHDIRTPLNGIMGMTRIAQEQTNPARTEECLGKIDRSSRFLLSLVNDILDMSKAGSGHIELHPEPYLFRDFMNYLDSVIRPLCDEKKQTLVIDAVPAEGVVPVMDQLRINQISFNLFSNAVKYTPEGGTITFRLREQLTAPNRMAMEIRFIDNGIGMSEKFQKVMFQPFTQEYRDDTYERHGSGLGLAIVQELTAAMHGTVEVESSPGRGSCFTLHFEVDCVPEKQAEQAAEKTEGGDQKEPSLTVLAGKHILLCEDHPMNQEIARTFLEEKQMIVDIADNGQIGFDRFRKSAAGFYDAVLMDIHMPVMDGYEATKKIRSAARADAGTVPIIAMTADAFTDDVQKCLDSGMDAHIAKPVDPETMYRVLAEHIGRKNGSGRGSEAAE
jgi:signal transduction histidine kinase/CheY-like chemotaxis protein